MIRRLCLLLPLCVFPSLVFGDDFAKLRLDNWHQWRGPEGNGLSPKGDPPVEWGEKTNLKWKTAIPGRGSSTPIVWNDRIYLQTAIDTAKVAAADDIPRPDPQFQTKTKPPRTYFQFVVVCINRKDGKIRWQKVAAEQVPHEGMHPTHSYAAYSPITDGKNLYVSFGSRGIYCYDLDGNLKWKQDLGKMHTRLGWGEGSSPALHGDTLIVNWDQEVGSFIVALDAATGKPKWKKDRDEVTSWNTPFIVEHKGRTQVIVNGAKRSRSYDLANGNVLWECGGQTINAIPCPLVFENLAILMSGYKGSLAVAVPLDATGDVTAKSAWKHEHGTPYVPSPVLSNGRLYFTFTNTNQLTCLDAKTGKVLIDRERLQGLTTLYASPTAAKDRIYFVDRDGNGLVIKHGDKIEVLAKNRLDEGIDASPVVVGKQLLLRGEKHLYCFEKE
jgi:outer membrane protein assembly factor BamB